VRGCQNECTVMNTLPPDYRCPTSQCIGSPVDFGELYCDCDFGRVCECIAGMVRACGPDQGDTGECAMGTEICTASNTWPPPQTACTGGIWPVEEECDADAKDEDCDGAGNPNPPCTCTPGQWSTSNCYDASYACHLGKQLCQPDATWGPCEKPPTVTTDQREYFYPDRDGDGYGDNTATSAATGRIFSCASSTGHPPAGYLREQTDCCDDDWYAHPGQTSYYQSRINGAPGVHGMRCGTYDYDCNWQEEMMSEANWPGCGYDLLKGACGISSSVSGWCQRPFICGMLGTWNYNCHWTGGTSCGNSQTTRYPPCR
jgi:hypothetical protein